MKSTLTAVIALLIAVGGLGCGSDSASGPSLDTTAHWTVQINTTAPAGPTVGDNEAERQAFALPGDPDSVTITGGALVIRSLRLLTDGVDAIDTSITAEDESRDQNDASIRFKGPYRLAFNGTATDLGTVVMPAGDYRRLVFVLQPGRSGENLGGSDDMIGRSIAVAGTVWRHGRGEIFVFATDYTSEFTLVGNFASSGGATVTGQLVFEASRWFRSDSRWLDPSDPANRRTILNNVRRNISARVEVTPTGVL